MVGIAWCRTLACCTDAVLWIVLRRFLCPSPVFDNGPGERGGKHVSCNRGSCRSWEEYRFKRLWTAGECRQSRWECLGAKGVGGSGVLLRSRMGGKSECSSDDSWWGENGGWGYSGIIGRFRRWGFMKNSESPTIVKHYIIYLEGCCATGSR